MKVCIIQPYYSMDHNDAPACFDALLGWMDQCDPSMDLIVLPEYCDIPAATPNADAFHASIRLRRETVARKAAETAKRCHALVFANFADETPTGYRNTTHVFDREGSCIGKYYKAHPAPSEWKTPAEGGNGMDCSYVYDSRAPYIVEAEGLRFAFLTCYDFYEYESFAAIARQKPDLIIGCSHQRTDTHETLETIGKFLCYQTNAYLVRSAVSLGADSTVCGCSMVVSPQGEMLLNMKNRVGLECVELDPTRKYEKPAGFRGRPMPHPEYLEQGRRPWLYRPAGSMIVPDDTQMAYPRICAHRGFSKAAPENTMPAFGAAIALGASEIETDVWATADGVLVCCHDGSLERVSDGTGKIWEHTYAELCQLDFGVEFGGPFAGLRILTLEELLRKFACTTVINLHVKIWDIPDLDRRYQQIADMIRRYGCEKHVYIMNHNDTAQAEFHVVAPEIRRCVGFDGNKTDMRAMVDRALRLGAEKVQLFKPYFTQETFDYAKEKGILINVFYADDPEEARRYLQMGADTVLTNNYLAVSNALGLK